MTRIDLHDAFFRAGGFLRSLSMLLLRPADMATLSRRYYCMENTVQGFADPVHVGSGLMPEEAGLLDQVPASADRRVLVLGTGGGRVVLALGRKGYRVYGIDHSPEMMAVSRQNCVRQGIRFHGAVQEVSQTGFRPGSFDLVFFTPALYSVIPTRHRRSEMLKTVYQILKPGGHVVCQFFWKADLKINPAREFLKKTAARLTCGYTEYETGDFMPGGMEFLHAFHDRKTLEREFHQAGFSPVRFVVFENGFFGGALLEQNR